MQRKALAAYPPAHPCVYTDAQILAVLKEYQGHWCEKTKKYLGHWCKYTNKHKIENDQFTFEEFQQADATLDQYGIPLDIKWDVRHSPTWSVGVSPSVSLRMCIYRNETGNLTYTKEQFENQELTLLQELEYFGQYNQGVNQFKDRWQKDGTRNP